MKFKIEYKKTSVLIPYAMNARTHSDAQVKQIAASITEFGFVNPVLLRSDNVIIAGHGRVLAAQQLGMRDVPTIVLDHLSERQARALVLADNKIAQNSGWDFEKLSEEMSALAQLDFDLSLIGFDEQELDGLLKDAADILPQGALEPEKIQVAGYERSVSKPGLTDDDEIPEEPVSVVSERGDVWMLGEHRLMCGDSTSNDDVSVLMDGEKSHMIFTDPPWNVNYGAVNAGNPQGYKPRTILNDHMSDENWAQFVAGFCTQLKLHSLDGAIIYLVMSAQEWPSIHKGLQDAGFHWSSTIIWAKDRLVLSRKDYHTQYEPIWYGWNDNGPRLKPLADRTQTDVWNFARPSVSELHPTTKPVELIVRAIDNSSDAGNVVLDLFGGSGSTLIACEKSGRRARSMELDPKYVDVIVKRWQDFTGKDAVHTSGKTFEQIKAERE